MREFLKGLDLDEETIDTIMAEHGKLVTKDKEKIQNLNKELSELKENSKGSAELQKKYDELFSQVEQEKKSKKDKIETDNILKAIGEQKFVNDYTKNSIVSEVKTAMSDEKNAGKSVKDLFEEITKDKEGIFANPNKPVDMPATNQNLFDGIDKEAFNKMGYKERLNLKAENPDLFEKLNN